MKIGKKGLEGLVLLTTVGDGDVKEKDKEETKLYELNHF